MEYKDFTKTVWSYYKKHGRHELSWRKTRTPYRILVSEIMLQQTQVDRVIPKYKSFIKQFPNFKCLGQARQRDVLIAWQELGYNRRALNLYKTAKIVTKQFNGTLPKERDELETLPGIGPYTAVAIRVFAHNIPDVMIETNIRTVFIHHFFPHKKKVADKNIEKLVEKTLDEKHPREWYYALMDYGTHLKKTVGNPNTRSTHYTKQSRFKGSNRELRGNILKLLAKKPETPTSLAKKLSKPKTTIAKAVTQLQKEGFVHQKNKRIALA